MKILKKNLGRGAGELRLFCTVYGAADMLSLIKRRAACGDNYKQIFKKT